MSKKEAIWMIAIVVVVIGAFYYYMKYVFKPTPKQPTEVMAANANTTKPVPAIDRQEWLLPEELKEISANVFQDDNRMACIQDNAGIIYIYNLQNKTIDEKIQFAEKGDYEGLAMVKNAWYVLRSDGLLYEVQPQAGKKPLVKTFHLPFEAENDMESLCFDSANNRLLIGVKEKDLTEKDKKGIYSFDLKSRQMNKNAVFYIESTVNGDDKDAKDAEKDKNKSDDKEKDDKDKGKKKKKGNDEIKPSGIAIDPKSNELYILDGPSSRLFIADAKGTITSRIQLDKKTFPQPEGLCFNSKGELYISSEAGKNEQGVIVKFNPD
ncbi:SdiA-regulated domain-containing protein [Longitalea arenae]|uniref:SdiA-regulated domain-containing protein n=1 Tax=Longitalea arenae TaxID=2812558 RepID=UPI0019674A00|nr:SdiA-regulated domain-containing protein [Longitalea arenae]